MEWEQKEKKTEEYWLKVNHCSEHHLLGFAADQLCK